jgi:(2R)-sulfolactate sulfo-lyase subunit beta
VVDGVLDKARCRPALAMVHGLIFRRGRDGDAVRRRGLPLHFFPTGQGSVIGNPILPVIKLCQSKTVRTMPEHIDVDVSGLLRKNLRPRWRQAPRLHVPHRQRWLTAAEALGLNSSPLYESA